MSRFSSCLCLSSSVNFTRALQVCAQPSENALASTKSEWMWVVFVAFRNAVFI